MEENNVKTEEIKVEAVEEKKKGKISKKVLAIGGTILALGIGAVVLLTRGNNDGDTNQNQIIDAAYEPVNTNSEVVE